MGKDRRTGAREKRERREQEAMDPGRASPPLSLSPSSAFSHRGKTDVLYAVQDYPACVLSRADAVREPFTRFAPHADSPRCCRLPL
jgi:hypothetical protein